VFIAVTVFTSCMVYGSLWTASWYGYVSRSSVELAEVGVDAAFRALLMRGLLVLNSARMEVRQLEVMRAVESSSTYKVRFDTAICAESALHMICRNMWTDA
jgi:hypothetical protein